MGKIYRKLHINGKICRTYDFRKTEFSFILNEILLYYTLSLKYESVTTFFLDFINFKTFVNFF